MKVESSYTFQQNLYMLRVWPKANLFCCKWCNSRLSRHSRVILGASIQAASDNVICYNLVLQDRFEHG